MNNALEIPITNPMLPTLSQLPDRTRKAVWRQSEDLIILSAVRRFGTQWERIAEILPGRSDDAVRNRWHRLQKQELGDGAENTLEQVRDLAAAIEKDIQELPLSTPTTNDHSRSAWTTEEDNIIEAGVRKYGAKWRKITAMLPGRSDSSARNRSAVLPPCPRPAACAAPTLRPLCPLTSLPRDCDDRGSPPSGPTGGCVFRRIGLMGNSASGWTAEAPFSRPVCPRWPWRGVFQSLPPRIPSLLLLTRPATDPDPK